MWKKIEMNILRSIQEEQLSIARARPDGASATLEDFKNMPYCLKVSPHPRLTGKKKKKKKKREVFGATLFPFQFGSCLESFSPVLD